MMSKNKRIGDIGEANCVAKLLTYDNVIVSKPIGDNCPYDLIIDVNGRLYRTQVKTEEKMTKGKMIFYLYTYNTKRKEKKPYDRNEVDLFLFYCMENGYIGLARLGELQQLTLTLTPKNKKDTEVGRNNIHKIRWAEDYSLDKRIHEL